VRKEKERAEKTDEAEERPVGSILGKPVNCFYGHGDLPGFDYTGKPNDLGQKGTRPHSFVA